MKMTRLLIAVSTGILVFSVSVVGVDYFSNSQSQCSEAETQVYYSQLPASHPKNHCATETKTLSWENWLTGDSRSQQLHFIDFLELLFDSTPHAPNSDRPVTGAHQASLVPAQPSAALC